MRKLGSLTGRRNSAERFADFMEPHFDALYGAARRMTLSIDDAEDLVQETCIKAYERLEELANLEFPRAWLLRVMYHQFVDDFRRAGRTPVDRSQTGTESGEPDELASGTEGPEEIVDRTQKVERILYAMQLLSGNQCALVAMHDIEDISVEELSELTGMPQSTVRSQLHRTRKKLGRLLSNVAVSKPRLKLIGGK